MWGNSASLPHLQLHVLIAPSTYKRDLPELQGRSAKLEIVMSLVAAAICKFMHGATRV